MSFEEPTTDARFLYSLAEHLHKTVGELAGLDPWELTGWKAYFRVRQDELEAEQHAQESEQAAKAGGFKWTRPGGPRREVSAGG